jgi:hypothetical protein
METDLVGQAQVNNKEWLYNKKNECLKTLQAMRIFIAYPERHPSNILKFDTVCDVSILEKEFKNVEGIHFTKKIKMVSDDSSYEGYPTKPQIFKDTSPYPDVIERKYLKGLDYVIYEYQYNASDKIQ